MKFKVGDFIETKNTHYTTGQGINNKVGVIKHVHNVMTGEPSCTVIFNRFSHELFDDEIELISEAEYLAYIVLES